jgi:hypothetical protein
MGGTSASEPRGVLATDEEAEAAGDVGVGKAMDDCG